MAVGGINQDPGRNNVKYLVFGGIGTDPLPAIPRWTVFNTAEEKCGCRRVYHLLYGLGERQDSFFRRLPAPYNGMYLCLPIPASHLLPRPLVETVQARFFPIEWVRFAVEWDIVAFIAAKVLSKLIKSPHHENVSNSPSRANSTRSSFASLRLRKRDRGSAIPFLANSSGEYFQISISTEPGSWMVNSLKSWGMQKTLSQKQQRKAA